MGYVYFFSTIIATLIYLVCTIKESVQFSLALNLSSIINKYKVSKSRLTVDKYVTRRERLIVIWKFLKLHVFGSLTSVFAARAIRALNPYSRSQTPKVKIKTPLSDDNNIYYRYYS